MTDRNLSGRVSIRARIGNQTRSGDAGVTPDMERLSIGIENVADILADIEQALAAGAA